MFSKLKATASAFAAAGILALAGAAAADAATITGGGAFSANAGTSRLVVTGGAAPLNCTTTGGSGSVNNGIFNPPPTVTVGTITPTFTNCTAFGFTFNVSCTTAAPNNTMLNISANPSGGVTPGTITLIRCVLTFPLASCNAVVEGSVPVTYANPGVVNTNGRLTVLVAGQALTVTSSTCTGLIPSGASAQFGAPSGAGSVANLAYNLTSVGPTIS